MGGQQVVKMHVYNGLGDASDSKRFNSASLASQSGQAVGLVYDSSPAERKRLKDARRDAYYHVHGRQPS